MELWNPGHIYTFMVEHGFQKDAKVFLAHNINGRALLVMGEDDLMELGMPEERASIFRSLVTDAFELSTQELAAQEDANQRLLEPFVPASNASRWTTTEVLQWLRAIDLPHLQPTFASAKINGHV